VVDAGGGYVGLLAHANGRYVTAETAGTNPLIADRTAIGSSEKFRIVSNPDGTVSLLANANNRYVTAESAGTKPLIANRTVIGTWEKFDRLRPPATVSLRAAVNSRYVTAESAGSRSLVANRVGSGRGSSSMLSTREASTSLCWRTPTTDTSPPRAPARNR
jgi:hypothetical protein